MAEPIAVATVSVIGAVIVGLGIAAIDAYNDPANDFTTMCQDADYIRIDDERCEDGNGHVHGSSVIFISTSSNYDAPAVGNRIDQSHILKDLPAGKTVEKAKIPKSGGVVAKSDLIQRGGFGGMFGSKGGGS